MAKRESVFSRTFRLIWRTVAVVYGLLMLGTLLLVPVVLYFVLSGPAAHVDKDIALVWAPVGDLKEQRTHDVRNVVMEQLTSQRAQETVVRDLVKSLDAAADDPRIKMAFLKLDEMGSASAGQLQDLAAAIGRFKQSGKKVVAWSPTYDQAQYYLAAQADEVYLDPLGYVFLEGYGVYRKYFKDALDKLGVEINVFRVGQYKSFVEPFTRNDMSPAARAANRAWLNSLWQTYKASVAPPRDLKPEAIASYINGFDTQLANAAGDAAEVALKAGLVDKLATLEDIRDAMRKQVGTDEDHGSFRQINNVEYLRAVERDAKPPRTDSKIGLVVIEGALVDAPGVAGAADGETIARQIARARRDDHTAAVVLRVNSPGGSIFASERIRREVALTRQAGKPVVVSMAGVAASGGYWISMNADQIWAQPNTITGSIGVFGIVPNFTQPLRKIGIHTDGLGTTELTGALRPDRPMSEQAKRILQTGIEHAYNEFTRKVADARGMSVEAVDRIAQGRVWSGDDAQRIGLVDKMGGFSQAIDAAASLAGLQPGDYELHNMRQPAGWRTALLDLFSLHADVSLLPDWLGRLASDQTFNWLRNGLSDPRGIYAYCFCEPSPADSRP